MDIILHGPPGAGKGTQSDNICEQLNIVAISTGDLIRAEIKGNTDLGQQIKDYSSAGKLVPDELVMTILGKRLEQDDVSNGVLFDGFPRTKSQAEALDNFLENNKMEINATISLEVEDNVLIKRLLERGKSSGRIDDQNESKIINRFKEYNKKTAPLKAYYYDQNKFYSVNGIGSIDIITNRLVKVIDSL